MGGERPAIYAYGYLRQLVSDVYRLDISERQTLLIFRATPALLASIALTWKEMAGPFIRTSMPECRARDRDRLPSVRATVAMSNGNRRVVSGERGPLCNTSLRAASGLRNFVCMGVDCRLARPIALKRS